MKRSLRSVLDWLRREPRRWLARRSVRRGALALVMLGAAVVIALIVRPAPVGRAPGRFALAAGRADRAIALTEAGARLAVVEGDLLAGRDSADILRLYALVVNELKGAGGAMADYAGSAALKEQLDTLELQISNADPHAIDTLRAAQDTLSSLR